MRTDVLGKHLVGKPRIHSESTKQKLSESANRRAAASAKGVSHKANGYIVFTQGENKDRGEHVVIIERRIGRRLKPDEVVHHIDGNRSNNSEDNLALMTRSGHTRLHRREELISKENSNGR